MTSSQSISPLSSQHAAGPSELRNTSRGEPDERSPLLSSSRSRIRIQAENAADGLPTPAKLYRTLSYPGSLRSVQSRRPSHHMTWSQRISHAVADRRASSMAEAKGSIFADDRVWYDQFTSTDWVHDSIADAYRLKALRARRDFWGRVYAGFDASQGWILSGVCGIVIAVIAYAVDVSESTVFDLKDGYCVRGWYLNEKRCCPIGGCLDWRSWSEVLGQHRFGEPWIGHDWMEFGVYVTLVVLLATAACSLTLLTKTVVPSGFRMATFDENLAARTAPVLTDDLLNGHVNRDSDADNTVGDGYAVHSDEDEDQNADNNDAQNPTNNGLGQWDGSDWLLDSQPRRSIYQLAGSQQQQWQLSARLSALASGSGLETQSASPPMVYYSAGGSGVAEVRVILSGFVLHGFLGLRTLVVKTAALVLSVASGLSLGKEGPYVHIATCVGNIACRLFSKYDGNDAKRREVLSAAAAAGVAVAFGAPLGGVLFGLEEVSYFFPAKTLFRTFFCCIVAALSLKALNPYGTHKIVMFQVRYQVDWEVFEIGSFIAVGVLGGAAGALFIKASKWWATSFRRPGGLIHSVPLLEVVLVALVTGLTSYWNAFTKLPVAKLLLELASPCERAPIGLFSAPLAVPSLSSLSSSLSSPLVDDHFGLCPTELADISSVLLRLLAAFLIKGFLTVITFGIKVPAGIYVPSMVVGGLMGRMVGHMMQWVVLRYPDWSVWASCAAAGPGSCIQPGVYGLIAAGSTMCGVTRLSVTLAVILFELTGSLDYVLPFSVAILVAKWTADWIEPSSIYDLLTNMNAYPFLDNKHKPVLTSQLAELVPRTVRRERVIDVSGSPLVPASLLRAKLELLHRAGELDGGLPIVRHGVLVGLIAAPDLEYGLDQLPDEPTSRCLMAAVPVVASASIEDEGRGGDWDEPDGGRNPRDFTRFIDPAPVALDILSPMDLVYECFVKLGLRYICVLKDGRYAGMTHKKTFVKYMHEVEQAEGKA